MRAYGVYMSGYFVYVWNNVDDYRWLVHKDLAQKFSRGDADKVVRAINRAYPVITQQRTND